MRGWRRQWRPRTPPLPDYLTTAVKPDDPEWFARELSIAAAPPRWFWRFVPSRFSWLVSLFGRVAVTGGIPEDLRRGPLLLAADLGEPGAHADRGGDHPRAGAAAGQASSTIHASPTPTRPTTGTAAYPGGVVPDDAP